MREGAAKARRLGMGPMDVRGLPLSSLRRAQKYSRRGFRPVRGTVTRSGRKVQGYWFRGLAPVL